MYLRVARRCGHVNKTFSEKQHSPENWETYNVLPTITVPVFDEKWVQGSPRRVSYL